jgi:hypothetical protein
MQSIFNLLLHASILLAGFVTGYGVRAWQSYRRQPRFPGLSSRISTFGHPRRAF